MEQPVTLVRDAAPAYEAPATRGCLNCGEPLSGPFCRMCGQRDLPPEPHINELVAEAWDAFVSVDGKVAQTLRLLLIRPGQLTAEYLSGRRARFLPPLRLYLLCSVLFFLVEAAAPNRNSPKAEAARKAYVDSVMAKNGKPRVDDATFAHQLDSVRALPHTWLWKRFKVNGLRVARDGKNFTTDFQTQIPRAMFVLMPAFALLLALFYRSRRRRYAAHLILSLHLHAFAFAALSFGAAIPWLPSGFIRKNIGLALFVWLLWYVVLALRRVYGGRLVPTILRAGGLAASYAIVSLFGMAAMAMLLVFLY